MATDRQVYQKTKAAYISCNARAKVECGAQPHETNAAQLLKSARIREKGHSKEQRQKDWICSNTIANYWI